ncbi:MAG: LytTR family DNA-binding domain-containing protein, partial [Bacteroidetes bacterium]|nr:LytTR family DNA-binding domain-containing protein [Bacteroidota bacterium]
FEMLELIENPPAIIFTTAFDQYAIKAFEVNAVDYLLKPFSEDRLNEAVNKIEQMLEVHDNQSKKLNALIEHRNTEDDFIDRVVIKHNNQIILIPVKDIINFEAQDDYVQIVTKDSKYLKQKTMKYFENNLSPADFIRVHRSYIVNISAINKIEILEKDTHILILKNGTKIPVSRSGYTKLKAVLN